MLPERHFQTSQAFKKDLPAIYRKSHTLSAPYMFYAKKLRQKFLMKVKFDEVNMALVEKYGVETFYLYKIKI